MIEKGVDASCSEDEMSENEESVNDDRPRTPAKTPMGARIKSQLDLKECFIPMKRLDIDGSTMMKHLGFKWMGDSLFTVKDKVYYSLVNNKQFLKS